MSREVRRSGSWWCREYIFVSETSLKVALTARWPSLPPPPTSSLGEGNECSSRVPVALNMDVAHLSMTLPVSSGDGLHFLQLLIPYNAGIMPKVVSLDILSKSSNKIIMQFAYCYFVLLHPCGSPRFIFKKKKKKPDFFPFFAWTSLSARIFYSFGFCPVFRVRTQSTLAISCLTTSYHWAAKIPEPGAFSFYLSFLLSLHICMCDYTHAHIPWVCASQWRKRHSSGPLTANVIDDIYF